MRGLQRGLVGVHVSRGLHVFQLRQQLSPLYMIALLDIQVGDLAKGICADIYVRLRLDFAGGADHCSQILPLRLSSLHCDHVLAALMNGERDNDYQ